MFSLNTPQMGVFFLQSEIFSAPRQSKIVCDGINGFLAQNNKDVMAAKTAYP
jgi:hypothetical protein